MRDCRLKRVLVSWYESLYATKENLLDKLNEFILKHLPLKKNKIVFDNFLGAGYGGNPKYIAEELHRRGLNYDLVWMAKDTSAAFPDYIRVVEYASKQARYELSTAKVFIDSVRNSYRVPKKKGQIYMQTWHSSGAPLKKIERDIEEYLPESYVTDAKTDGYNCDAVLASNQWQFKQYQKAFWLNPKTEILCFGLPRNDVLLNKSVIEENRAKVKKNYNISDDIGVILYMPTFRDNDRMDGYITDIESVLNAFKNKFQKDFICIVRFHPNVSKQSEFYNYGNKIINATNYPDVQELYSIGDFLITDYSSTALDFALLDRPVFIIAIDFEKYKSERPMYDEFVNLPFVMNYSINELFESIENFSYEEYLKNYNKLNSESYDRGNASSLVVDWLEKKINK